TNPQPPRQETLDRSRRAAWAGDYDAALAALDSVIDVRPDETELLEERARVLAWAERWEEAAAALAEATDTADTEAVLERARYLWWGSRPLEADSLLSSLLEREPGLEAALALQDEIRPGIDPSVEVAQRWVAERPDDAQTRLWLARALVEAGRPEDALPHYRRALTGEGAVSPDVLLEAAGVALGVDALHFAAEHFRRYLDEVDPYDRDVRLRLARTLAWSARWTEAEARYREALTA
ncbi:MAG: tetratricopeptide repeat protein, partial [Gammaproteobacteria bacterium]|nr:tetratricopeptide repeat protein [Gemmatimonadota bacterium]NIU78944.1 tetratricopeptide repeat protein [Gammaproteobacteria bacterium]